MRLGRAGKGFLQSEDRPVHVDIEVPIEMLLGHLLQHCSPAIAAFAKTMSACPSRLSQLNTCAPIAVTAASSAALRRPKNEDMSPFGHKFLGRRQPDARCPAGDYGDLALK
jgi:hypothetical protein